MSILTLNDFKQGRYIIPLNPKQGGDLQIQIDYVENHYLKRLFGIALYNLFIADLAAPTAGQPTDPRFVTIFNHLDYEDSDDCIYTSEGIKEMLKGLVYFYYLRDLNRKVTTTGTIESESANSKNVSQLWENVTSRYNQAIDSYNAMQYYMACIDANTYPEFTGNHVEKVTMF